MFYFAYGSNMNHAQMKMRCPSAVFIQSGQLKDYAFVYDGDSSTWEGPVANIIEDKMSKAYGGLFDINNDNLAALDCYEGFPRVYQRKSVQIIGKDNKPYDAIAYLRVGEKKGQASNKYRTVILQGAKDCGLPVEYIQANL